MRTQKSFQNQVFTKGILYEKNVGYSRTSPHCMPPDPYDILMANHILGSRPANIFCKINQIAGRTSVNSVDADVVGGGCLPSPCHFLTNLLPFKSMNRWLGYKIGSFWVSNRGPGVGSFWVSTRAPGTGSLTRLVVSGLESWPWHMTSCLLVVSSASLLSLLGKSLGFL